MTDVHRFTPAHPQGRTGLQLTRAGVVVTGASLDFLAFASRLPRDRLPLDVAELVDAYLVERRATPCAA